MKHLLPAAVLMLMVSVGMSLSPRQLLDNWGRLTPSVWARLLAATFLVPPLLALALGWVLPMGAAATAGLFLIAVVPGAPLMTRVRRASRSSNRGLRKFMARVKKEADQCSIQSLKILKLCKSSDFTAFES